MQPSDHDFYHSSKKIFKKFLQLKKSLYLCTRNHKHGRRAAEIHNKYCLVV